MSISGAQLDPLALEVFVDEETALREMVEIKCGAVVDSLITAVESPSAAKVAMGGGGR